MKGPHRMLTVDALHKWFCFWKSIHSDLLNHLSSQELCVCVCLKWNSRSVRKTTQSSWPLEDILTCLRSVPGLSTTVSGLSRYPHTLRSLSLNPCSPGPELRTLSPTYQLHSVILHVPNAPWFPVC